MTVPEWLGWARSFLDSMGLLNFVIAAFVITLAVIVVRRFFGGGD